MGGSRAILDWRFKGGGGSKAILDCILKRGGEQGNFGLEIQGWGGGGSRGILEI